MMLFRAGQTMGKVASLLMLLALVLLAGCQGRPKTEPPIHVNPNMDTQPRYMPQAYSPFFEDHATMRPPIEGTLALSDTGWRDPAFYEGLESATGDTVTANQLALTMSVMERGRERYDIYCAVCHGRAGDAKSIMIERGYVPPPSFHTEPVTGYHDGHIFQVITHGIRNMPGYANQVPAHDRWAIIHYLRALQLSQGADMADVPRELRDRLK